MRPLPQRILASVVVLFLLQFYLFKREGDVSGEDEERNDEMEFLEEFSGDDLLAENFEIDFDEEKKDDEELDFRFPGLSRPPNGMFVFHNKLPKSGSTTMKWLMSHLQKRNNFKLDHQRFCIHKDDCYEPYRDDGPNGRRDFANYMRKTLEKNKGRKYILLKHHHWFNFTEFDLPMPTFINVARNPVTRFASRYYFQRFGWSMGKSGSRTNFHGSAEDLDRSLDDCVKQSVPECTDALQVMVKYFCGTSDECNKHSSHGKTKWSKVAISAEIAKKNILREFFFVGLLEKFDESLEILENILPGYFDGAREMMKNPAIEKKRSKSKSKIKAVYSNETREALEHGILKYEMEIYSLIEKLFHERLSSLKK